MWRTVNFPIERIVGSPLQSPAIRTAAGISFALLVGVVAALAWRITLKEPLFAYGMIGILVTLQVAERIYRGRVIAGTVPPDNGEAGIPAVVAAGPRSPRSGSDAKPWPEV